MKVFLNPGHAPGGHPDPGAVNSESGLRECDVALAVGQSAENYLNAAGVATELLQSDSLEEICEAANARDALARAVARGITDYEQLILGGK